MFGEAGWSGYYDQRAEAYGSPMGDLWDSGGAYGGEYQQRSLPGGMGTVTAPSGLRLRQGPSTSDGTITVMPYNSQIEILDLGAAPGWYQVQHQGTVGYASSEWIEVGGSRRGSITIDPTPIIPPSPPPAPTPPEPAPSPPAPPPAPVAQKKSNTLLYGALAAVGAVAAYYLI